MNRKVIVIDDDKNILDSYHDILTEQEDVTRELESIMVQSDDTEDNRTYFDVESATQGRAGFNLAKEAFKKNEPFAVAFIDMRMPPGWDGLETAKALRELDDRIYIVIVTAYADKSVDEIDDVLKKNILLLRKPFVSEEIFQLARNLTDSWNRDKKLNEYSNNLEKLVSERTAELEKSYKSKETIVSSIPSAILLIDNSYNIIDSNQAYENLINNHSWLTPKLVIDEIASFPRRDLSKKVSELYIQQPNVDNAEKLVLSVFLLTKNFDENEALLIITDITEEKNLAVMLEHSTRISALSEIGVGVAHEMNTPLQTLMTILQLANMDDNYPAEKRQEDYKNMMNIIMHLSTITEQMRRMARFEPNEDFLDIDVAELINSIKILLSKRFERHNIEILFTLPEKQIFIKGVFGQLQQVLTNLLNNAREELNECEKGSTKRVKVECKEDGDSVVIRISDTGRGITEDIKQKIFQPFFSTKRPGSGTGIGLSIISKIIDGHKGSIKLVEEEGFSTTFELRFDK